MNKQDKEWLSRKKESLRIIAENQTDMAYKLYLQHFIKEINQRCN